MTSQLQLVNYVLSDIMFKDPHQFEIFLRTQLGANINYNSMQWSPVTKQLTVFTGESLANPSTLVKLQDIVAMYPDPDPDPSYDPPESLSNPGELLTFDRNKNKVAVLSRGFPGQVLTCDPLASIGMRWKDVYNGASSGESPTITDDYIRYLEMYDSSGNIQIFPDDIHSIITYNIERRKDTPTFIHDEFSGEFTVTEPGTYLLTFKVGLRWSSAPVFTNGKVIIHLEVKPPNSDVFVDIIGTHRGNTLLRRYADGENSTFVQCIYRCVGGESFRVIVTEATKTGILVSSAGLSSANAFKCVLGAPGEDLTSAIYSHNTGYSMTLPLDAETSVDIPFQTNTLLDTMFFTKESDTVIRFNQSAGFYLNSVVGLETVGGNPGDSVTYMFNLMIDKGTGVWEPMTACWSKVSVVVGLDNISGTKSVILPIFAFFNGGTRLKLTCTFLSRTGTITVKTIDGGSVFLSMCFASANVKYQQAVRGFNAYSTIAQPLLFGTWSDIPINVTRVSHQVFIQNNTYTMLQCSEPGTYYILYKITVTTPANSLCNTTTRLVVNGGQGFFEAIGCRASQLITGGDRHSTMCGMALLNLGYNYQIKLQAVIRDLGTLRNTDIVSTVPECCEVFIAKFESTISPLPSPGDIVFGSHYKYVDDFQESSTTSTEFTEKLSISTANVPTGGYRINWNFFYTSSSPTGLVSIRLLRDDAFVVSDVILPIIQSNVYMPYNEFAVENLSGGIHRYSLQWKTLNGLDSASVKGAKIEIFRVT